MQMRTRIKFCGLRRAEDIDTAVALGVDAIGFVLWPNSKRAIDLDMLARLSRRIPAFVTRVGLFVDQPVEEVAAAAKYLDLIQYHGDESPEQCKMVDSPWIKALRMREGIDLFRQADLYSEAQGVLLDAYLPGLPGGTGEQFDWSRIPADLPMPVILAGGLEAGNVAAAIQQVSPFAVDVSGGIESAPGIKDSARMASFVSAIQWADGKIRHG